MMMYVFGLEFAYYISLKSSLHFLETADSALLLCEK